MELQVVRMCSLSLTHTHTHTHTQPFLGAKKVGFDDCIYKIEGSM